MRSGGAQNVQGNSRVLIYLFFLHYIVSKDMNSGAIAGQRGRRGITSSVLVQCIQGTFRWRCPAVDWICKSVVRREAGAGGRNFSDIHAGMAGEATGGEI